MRVAIVVAAAAMSMIHGSAASPFRSRSAPPHVEAAVGVVSFVIADGTRRDPVASKQPREWRVDLYYPAIPRRGRAAGPYANDRALLTDMEQSGYYGQPKGAIERWRHRPAPAVRDARPIRRVSPLPLITISPGMGVAAFNYSIIAARLVRLGFAVAVIDHPYIGWSRLPGGRFLRSADDPVLQDQDQEHWNARIADWRQDISVTLDRLNQTAMPGYPNGLHLAPSGVTVAGHSLGGAVALDACRHDPRVSACADFEGATFGTETIDKGPVKPVLFVLSRSAAVDRPRADPDFAAPLFSFLAKGGNESAWAVKVTGGSHMSFSDAPYVMPDTLSRFGGSLMSPERSMDLYSGLLAAFARAYRPNGGGAAAFEDYVSNVPEINADHVRRAR